MKTTLAHSKAHGASQNSNCGGIRGAFRLCSQWLSLAVGSHWAFLLAALSIIVWALLGPVFHFSDTWQLVINTATTIVTFLMVFLIQNTQNRDTKALHLKLDELLRGVVGARTSFVNLENLSDEELEKLQQEFERVQSRAAKSRAAPPDRGSSSSQKKPVQAKAGV
jgi:low affinity Fe/Cu permease